MQVPTSTDSAAPLSNAASRAAAPLRGKAGASQGTISGMLRQLDQTQWQAPELIRRWQLKRLQKLLRHAYTTTPYYRHRLEAAQYRFGPALDEDSWAEIPLLTRRDIQDAAEQLLSSSAPANPRITRSVVTSGSTGQPVCTASTPQTRLHWHVLTLRDHRWHQRDLGQKLAVIRHTRPGAALPPDGEMRESWGIATDRGTTTGPGLLLSIQSTIEEQAAWLVRHDPAYLLCYPSNLEALADHFLSTGIQLPGLQQVRTFGEILDPRIRETCRQAWDVTVTDVYSTQEVGYVALQCPEHEHYHVQSESVMVEVLDEQGKACLPGETGRVVISSLHNFATPLIRYDLGDYAEVGSSCPCGRRLPVLRKILGRQRNMLVLPDGQKRWPGIGQGGDLVHLPRFRQFQLIQRSVARIDVLIVAQEQLSEEEQTAASDYLARALGHPFEFVFIHVDEIPRHPGGKFEDFRSEVA